MALVRDQEGCKTCDSRWGGTEYKSHSSPEIRKKLPKQLQNPPSRVGPQKYEKITEKIRKRPFSEHFCNFRSSFIFGAQPGRGGDFVIVSVIFFVFRV